MRLVRGVLPAIAAAGLVLAVSGPALALLAPSASFTASPNPVLTGDPVVFDASASAPAPPEEPIVEYRWDFDGDGSFDLSEADPVTSHSYPDDGSPTVKLEVVDSAGDSAQATQSVTIVNRPPTAVLAAAPNPALTGQSIGFDASNSGDLDGTIVDYKWDLDGNGSFETDSDADSTVERSYATAGVRTISVKVTDDDGASDEDAVSLTIRNRAPSASFTMAPNPALTGKTVGFDASASNDFDGTIVKYEWDFDGNGSFETNAGGDPTTARSFRSAGRRAIGLKVTDDDGRSGETTRLLVIEAPNRPPFAFIEYSPESPTAGQPVEFSGLVFDPDGPLKSVSWDLDGDLKFDDAKLPFAIWTFTVPGRYLVGLKAVDTDGASDIERITVTVGAKPLELINPFPVVRLTGQARRSGTRVRRLGVRAPKRAKVSVRCLGPRCPRGRTLKKVGSRTLRFRRFERFLPPGTLIAVRIRQPGKIGKYTRFRIRAGEPPARLDRCLMPRASRPQRCPRS